MQFIEQANKHQRHFWIQTFIKAKDSEAIQFLMCVRTLNLPKYFNLRTSPRATYQESKKASSKARFLIKVFPLSFQGLTLTTQFGYDTHPFRYHWAFSTVHCPL